MPRLAGQESSPLPAGTPFGNKKSKLSDPASFQRSLLAANDHFSLEGEGIRDFQIPEAGSEFEDSILTPCL